jgi:hypothetical protein
MNLDAVMARLSKYNPQQLQQFAATHKDDPIMLAAASSVKNKMDKLQQAYQAKASGQQPPPVNEQVVQSMDPQPQPQMPPQGMPPQGMPPQGMPPQGMPQASSQLPEQQGIAQLPTPNMQQMAGGGIVAFADGGYTDQEMSDNSSPVTFMADGGVARFADTGLVPPPLFNQLPAGSYGAPQVGAVENQPWAQRKMDELVAKVQAGTASPQEKAWVAMVGGDATSRVNARQQQELYKKAPDQLGGENARLAAKAKPIAIDKISVDKPDVGDRAAPPQDRPQARPQPKGGVADIPTKDYRTQLDSYMPKETVDPFATQRSEINDAATAAARERATRLREDIAAEGKAGLAQEERLGKREGALNKQKDLNMSMSLLEAGLATMQSRGKGLAGIAEGSTVGLKSYNSGIQRLQSAQEKIDDARDRLDELRRNESRMNNREVRAAENDIQSTILSGKRDALAGVQQAYGINKQDARTFFEAQTKADEGAKDRASRKEIAQMQASAPSDKIQLLQMLGGKGGVEEGLRVMTSIQAGKRTIEQSYEDYMKAFAGKDTTVTPPLTPQQYVAQINQIRALSQVPKASGAPTGQALP